MALGKIEIDIRFVRRKPVHALEWLSLVIVLAAGAGTLVTDDPRCLLIKPPVICAAPGIDTLRACNFFFSTAPTRLILSHGPQGRESKDAHECRCTQSASFDSAASRPAWNSAFD